MIDKGNFDLQESKSEIKDIWLIDRSLITKDDINEAIGRSINKICILPGTIITPLASDLAKENGISINRSSEKDEYAPKDIWKISSTDKIAVLSSYYDEAYKIKTKEILRNKGHNVECISPKNFTAFELENSLNKIIEDVRAGKYKSAIIISNDAFKLMENLRKNQNLNTNICWEIDTNKGCSVKSKFLFVNSALIGFKMLEAKITAWIRYNNS